MMTTHAANYTNPRWRLSRRSSRRGHIRREAPRQISPAVRATVELLDQRFRVPVLNIRFGMDAIIGLIPGVGDLIGMVLGYGLVLEAIRLRARWRVVGKMLVNLWIDAVIGAVPLVGDIFDFFTHAHRRNLDLLQRELAGS
jgi:hypothetical protein